MQAAVLASSLKCTPSNTVVHLVASWPDKSVPKPQGKVTPGNKVNGTRVPATKRVRSVLRLPCHLEVGGRLGRGPPAPPSEAS